MPLSRTAIYHELTWPELSLRDEKGNLNNEVLELVQYYAQQAGHVVNVRLSDEVLFTIDPIDPPTEILRKHSAALYERQEAFLESQGINRRRHQRRNYDRDDGHDRRAEPVTSIPLHVESSQEPSP